MIEILLKIYKKMEQFISIKKLYKMKEKINYVVYHKIKILNKINKNLFQVKKVKNIKLQMIYYSNY
jgi:hypothetical protein